MEEDKKYTNEDENYSFYRSKVSLPRVSKINRPLHGNSSNVANLPKKGNEVDNDIEETHVQNKDATDRPLSVNLKSGMNADTSCSDNIYLEPVEARNYLPHDNLINQYQEFLENRYDTADDGTNHSESSVSSTGTSVTISSLSSDRGSSAEDSENDEDSGNSKLNNDKMNLTCTCSKTRLKVSESLPDFTRIDKKIIDPETLSEKLTSSNIYETLDGNYQNNFLSPKKKSFQQVAKFVTLMPKLTTESVRSRQVDHSLTEICQYLPDKKLKIFVGTWNMKGTKILPSNLESFLLPTESLYLQDVYVIGAQEGTPFRREWHVKLQETFGPSHVLVHSCNFGVLQLAVFIRRELVWFCSNVEQDTTATRVGHKIKTKGALAVSFSIFGTSFLFITSHFTSHQGKIQERIDDYKAIQQNIQLPSGLSKEEVHTNVTEKFDRVFWFGDFNFRVRKSRKYVDELLSDSTKDEKSVLTELLQHDELHALFQKKKIFHGFSEAPIHFFPTYKFDVDSDRYDTSTKRRVPSWTDRIVFKSRQREDCHCICYNSCNFITVSDHRPVYGIFDVTIHPFGNSRFTFGGGQFDRDIYVEANLRRNAPSGNQESSNVCTIL